MPLSAIALVLVAALLHAGWNIVAKRTGGGKHFVMMGALMIVGLWAPLGLVMAWQQLPQWGWREWALLLAGYRAADLTVVYPVARGTGPLVSAFAAQRAGRPGRLRARFQGAVEGRAAAGGGQPAGLRAGAVRGADGAAVACGAGPRGVDAVRSAAGRPAAGRDRSRPAPAGRGLHRRRGGGAGLGAQRRRAPAGTGPLRAAWARGTRSVSASVSCASRRAA